MYANHGLTLPAVVFCFKMKQPQATCVACAFLTLQGSLCFPALLAWMALTAKTADNSSISNKNRDILVMLVDIMLLLLLLVIIFIIIYFHVAK